MYNEGSAEFNELITKSGGNALVSRLIFSDFTLENLKKLEYYGGSNNSNDIAIGTANMAYLDVSAITDRIITNQEFLFEVGMELADGTIEYAPMGYFTVQKPDSDEDSVSFRACDRMQKFEKPYFSALTYPTDSAKVLNELCTMCGVELATPITNQITITDKLEGYTCREVLGFIAGIHGYFACFDRYGKLNLRWYSETPIEKQIGLIWSLTKSQSNYRVEKITLAKDSETTYTSGTGISGINHSNPYATQAIADSIYTSLGGFAYRPCEISMLDDIRLDPWDMLRVTYLDGSVLTIPVMSLSHSFTNGETKVKSVGKSDTENEYSYSGPVTQAMNRMATEMLVANRVIATKVDAEYVQAHAITTDNISAIEAEIKNAVIEEVSAEYADIRLANIDTANIDVANIGLLFAKVGLIDRATIVDGHITGFLDAVEVNANNITAGTLIADRILLKGSESGLLYALNNLGELTSTRVDTLDGTILTQRTIAADKLIAKSITTDELNVTNIFGDSAVLTTLTSQEAFINAISTNSVVVGASNTANNALNTVNNLEIGGRNLLQNSANMTFSTYGGATAVTEKNIAVSEWGATDAMRVHGVSGAGTFALYHNTGSKYLAGVYYTTSIYVKNNHSTNHFILLNNLGNAMTVYPGETKRVVLVGSAGNNIAAVQIRIDTVPNSGFDITYWHPQIEEGNKATDWSPAPEDISVENVYTPNTTTIDGGKITTGSIKAAQIDVTDLFARNINVNGTFTATGNTWVYPTNIDLQKFAEYGSDNDFSDIPASLVPAYDLNVSGNVTLHDFAGMKSMVLWPENWSKERLISEYGYSPINSDVSVVIDPSDAEKVIDITTTTSWGNDIECYFGVNGVKTTKVDCSGKILGDSMAITDGITAGQDIASIEDIVAGYGTDNEVSLLDLATLVAGKQASITWNSNTSNGYIKIPGIKVMIAWKRISWTGTIASAWGSIYESSSAISMGNWAAAFSATPVVTYSAYQGIGVFVEQYAAPTTTSAGSVFLARGSSLTTSKTYYVTAIAVGTYS